MLDFSTLQINKLYSQETENRVFFIYFAILIILIGSILISSTYNANKNKFGTTSFQGTMAVLGLIHIVLVPGILGSIPTVEYRIQIKGLTTQQEDRLIENQNRGSNKYMLISNKLYYVEQFSERDKIDSKTDDLKEVIEEKFTNNMLNEFGMAKIGETK